MTEDDAYDREIQRAEWFAEVGQDERAMQILSGLLARHPDNAGNTYIALAYAHTKAGRMKDTEAAARRAIASLPDNPNAHRFLGHALLYQDKELEAERPLRTALELAPEDDFLHFLMSTALASLDRDEEALFYAREAVRLAPGQARNHMALATAQMDKDPAAAEASLQEALTLDPTYSHALFRLAWVRSKRGDHVGAARAIASYTTQASDPSEARAAVDDFFHEAVFTLHYGMLACALFMLMSAVLVRLADLPNWLLLLPLSICAGLTFRAVGRRVQALRLAFAGRGRLMARSFIRRQRFSTAWALLLLITWVALGVGAIQLLLGGIVILAGALGVGLLLLISTWIFARLKMQ